MNINEVIAEINLHFKRTDSVIRDVENLPMEEQNFDDPETVKTMDAFIYRFIKIQDKMGDKLFPAYLQLLQEYDDDMPLLDVLNDLERLRVIDSAQEWIEFRKLRNSLTHEYPGNEDEIIEALRAAVLAYQKMKTVYNKIKNDVKTRINL